jgi:DsbC/DsbD-like thiol-disulfide interchange protein
MRSLKWWLLGLALFAPAVYALTGNSVATDNVKARLLSEQDSIAPGQSVWVALELDIRDGWHTYWRNPGDSGQATQIAWSLPPGLTAGDIEWTTPHRFVVAPLVNYGYAKQALHLVKISASPDLKAAAPLDLKAKAGWLVCADVCIPESADLDLKLPVTAAGGPKDPSVAQLFDHARAELPGAAPAASSARIVDGRLVITLGKEWGATLSRIKSLTFYPFDDGVIEYAAPQALSRRDGAVELAVKLGYQPPRSGSVRGVLLATEDGGAPGAEPIEVPIEIAASFSGPPAPASAAGPRFAPALPAVPPARTPGLAALMLLAVLGGLILNLMPCVFPVLSIKAIGLVEQAKKHPAAVRAKGLVFAAGVIASMLVLAGVLLGLRAGGEEIGWGFQLQSPLFVTFMI